MVNIDTIASFTLEKQTTRKKKPEQVWFFDQVAMGCFAQTIKQKTANILLTGQHNIQPKK